MKDLFLDDFRTPLDAFNYTKDPEYLEDKWLIVRSYNEFILAVLDYWKEYGKLFELASYDHDLADIHINKSTYKEKTGYDCAKFLVDFCLDNNVPLPKYKIHSQNTVGAENILKLLQNFEKFQKENG